MKSKKTGKKVAKPGHKGSAKQKVPNRGEPVSTRESLPTLIMR